MGAARLFRAYGTRGPAPGYCIQLPPPNVTGTLHMGHAFQQTLMDTLVRYHRMRGDNTNWWSGTDHAGIATQIVVERQLRGRGKDPPRLGPREIPRARVAMEAGIGFHHHAPDARGLASSCDWSARATSHGRGMSRAVTRVFVRLHQEGLIYRGKRLVNWDPVLQTAVSDLEVDSEEEDGKLWHIQLSARARVRASHRGHDAAGDHARRRRRRGHPDDERYTASGRQASQLPLTGRDDPGDRRRLCRPGVRHRLRQDHPGA